ncbi:MAG: bacterial Ig-like domain-containing protein [Clostridiales bacterium]|nr:bacterial Ig-like domain-containing protein [Clostridiales bacterium]
MKRILLSISIFIISTTIFCLAACKGNIETPNLPDTDENETPPTPVEYVVRFDTVGGNEILSVKVSGGERIERPAAPVKEGFVFGGWYLSSDYSERWNFESDAVNGNITLYAKWDVVTTTGIRVSAESTQKKTFSREEFFSYTGLVVEKVKSDGKTEVLNESEYEVTCDDYDKSKPDRYKVTVTSAYGKAYYYVIVDGIKEIRIKSNSEYKRIYADGDEIDLTGITVERVYSDGNVVDSETGEYDYSSQNGGGKTVSGVDGKDYIVIKNLSENLSVKAEVTVVDVSELSPTAIFLAKEPTVKQFPQGGTFNHEGLVVEKTTELFGERRFAMTEREYIVSFAEADAEVEGRYKVTVIAAKDKELKLYYYVEVVAVSDEITGIEIARNCDRTEFFVGENLDLSGLKIQKTYNNGAKIDLKSDEYIVNSASYDKTAEGRYEIVVTLSENTGFSTSFYANVVTNPISGIYYGIEGIAAGYAFAIDVDLNYYGYNGESIDKERDEDLTENVKSFVRNGRILKMSDGATFNIDTKVYTKDGMEYKRLADDDIILSLDGVDGNVFFVVKKGEGFSAEQLEEYAAEGVKLYLKYDVENGEIIPITENDKFYENTVIFIVLE